MFFRLLNNYIEIEIIHDIAYLINMKIDNPKTFMVLLRSCISTLIDTFKVSLLRQAVNFGDQLSSCYIIHEYDNCMVVECDIKDAIECIASGLI